MARALAAQIGGFVFAKLWKVVQVVLMLVGLLALPIFWMNYEDGELRRAAQPPWEVRTLADFRKWRPQHDQALKLESGGFTYYLVFGERSRVLASGKSGYLFDERGNLIGWVLDTGDDSYLRVAIDQSARKESLSTAQIVVSPPAAANK
jgi:hypothetical protein